MEAIKKHKKTIKIAIVIIVVLFICYLIGQNIVLPNRMRSAGYVDADGNIPRYSILQNFNSFSIKGQAPADVPGSTSIQKIEFTKDNAAIPDEWLGNCIFMLPNTSFAKVIDLDKKSTKIDLEYGIYPDKVTEVSDGADLYVEVYVDGKSKPVIREKLKAEPNGELNRAKIDISKCAGEKVSISFSCQDGGNGNEDADWMMIKYPVIE